MLTCWSCWPSHEAEPALTSPLLGKYFPFNFSVLWSFFFFFSYSRERTASPYSVRKEGPEVDKHFQVTRLPLRAWAGGGNSCGQMVLLAPGQLVLLGRPGVPLHPSAILPRQTPAKKGQTLTFLSSPNPAALNGLRESTSH